MAYGDARRAATQTGLRRATLLLALPLALALAVVVRVFGQTMPVRTLGLIAMLALATLTHVLVQQQHARRVAIPVAVAFVLGLGVCLLGVLAEAPQSVHVQLGLVSAITMASAILVPWGLVPQLVVAVAVAVGYTQLPRWLPVDPGEVGEHAVALFDMLALSVVGAWVLDRQRRAAYRERVQHAGVLRHQQLLYDAGRELGASRDLDETVASIARMALHTFEADTAAVVLLDDARGMLRTATVVGALTERDRETDQLEVPASILADLVEAVRTHGVVCVPDALPWLAEVMRAHFDIHATLYLGMEHEGRLLGWVAVNHRRPGVRFDDDQVWLARGFATSCAIALAKGLLVSDLQRANRVKNEFVSTMSHELRTPLHVILGYADLLDDVVAEPEARRGVDRIRVASRELLDLIEATLDLNRLESGQDAPRLAPLDVGELWDDLASEFGALPRSDAVALRWEREEGAIALTDRRKLKIVVKNLVGNALKFTREGEVVVSARREGDRCVVRVRDTGVGIPAEHLPAIFEMFRQLDSSDRRSFGGVGLGLYIVRKLAEQLGATLEVESALGVGTTFTVGLPAASARATAAA